MGRLNLRRNAKRSLWRFVSTLTTGNARLRVSPSVTLSMRRNARLSTRKIAKQWNRMCALMFQRKIATTSLLWSAVMSLRRCVRRFITRRYVEMSPSRSASSWKRRFVLQLRKGFVKRFQQHLVRTFLRPYVTKFLVKFTNLFLNRNVWILLNLGVTLFLRWFVSKFPRRLARRSQGKNARRFPSQYQDPRRNRIAQLFKYANVRK